MVWDVHKSVCALFSYYGFIDTRNEWFTSVLWNGVRFYVDALLETFVSARDMDSIRCLLDTGLGFGFGTFFWNQFLTPWDFNIALFFVSFWVRSEFGSLLGNTLVLRFSLQFWDFLCQSSTLSKRKFVSCLRKSSLKLDSK